MVVVLTGVMLLYKLRALVYPQGQFVIEGAILVGYALLSYARLQAGIKGNKIERVTETTVMLLLACFTLFANCYFLLFQTYILVIEVVLQSAAIAFTGIEMLLGLIAILIFGSLDKQGK